jgi:hypothetical protein
MNMEVLDRLDIVMISREKVSNGTLFAVIECLQCVFNDHGWKY